ncbi:hypothetical protein OSL56_25085, partial [Escherichia coli]|nr:hypothetical protein [Escherichia coli]
KRVFLVILFTSFSGSLVSRISGAVQDEYFWRHILHRGHQQVLFVVTQADKTEPCHEWDMAGIQPSPAQEQNIREKTDAVFRLFRPVHPVVAVSARTGWELDTLVSALMTAL